ncbi:conserved hypothetical protein [delta proteobacterium NaphS2]|nr:conserved hypothetical protein [delta proteobacterium NaphS2]
MAQEGDVVLIYHEKNPMAFARVEDIRPDIKKDWYHITLLLLTIPTQVVTWILKDDYINGEEFTMGGKPMRLEEVKKTVLEKTEQPPAKKERPITPSPKQGTVIPFKKP